MSRWEPIVGRATLTLEVSIASRKSAPQSSARVTIWRPLQLESEVSRGVRGGSEVISSISIVIAMIKGATIIAIATKKTSPDSRDAPRTHQDLRCRRRAGVRARPLRPPGVRRDLDRPADRGDGDQPAEPLRRV